MKFKQGDRVSTCLGFATIIKIERGVGALKDRYEVKLDHPSNWSLSIKGFHPSFWDFEISLLKGN